MLIGGLLDMREEIMNMTPWVRLKQISIEKMALLSEQVAHTLSSFTTVFNIHKPFCSRSVA
jgi:hypothetical protein